MESIATGNVRVNGLEIIVLICFVSAIVLQIETMPLGLDKCWCGNE